MKYETRYEIVKLESIVPPPYNPRIDVERDSSEYEALRRSIEEHGMVEPPVVNLHNMRCIGGNQRLTVLRDLGWKEVLCSVIDQPDERQEKKLCLALNRIDGRWDTDKLSELLRESDVLEFETGFTPEELAVYCQLEDVYEPEEYPDETNMDADDYGIKSDAEPNHDIPEEYGEGENNGDAPGTLIRIGNFTFRVAVSRYQQLIGEIRDRGIFRQSEIISAIRRRLLNHEQTGCD